MELFPTTDGANKRSRQEFEIQNSLEKFQRANTHSDEGREGCVSKNTEIKPIETPLLKEAANRTQSFISKISNKSGVRRPGAQGKSFDLSYNYSDEGQNDPVNADRGTGSKRKIVHQTTQNLDLQGDLERSAKSFKSSANKTSNSNYQRTNAGRAPPLLVQVPSRQSGAI